MIYKVLLVICLLAECVLAPLYIKAIKPGFSTKTLIIKAAASTAFALTGLFAGLATDNIEFIYSRFMLIGFVCSVLGDVFLHGNPKIFRCAIGGVSFLCAHIFFVLAYIKTTLQVNPEAKVISAYDIAAIAVLLCIELGVFKAMKLKMGLTGIPVVIYAAVLDFMLVKAAGLGVSLVKTGASGAVPACALLCIGAVLFVLSDITLGIGFFGEQTRKRRIFNMSTYFAGQTLLALTLLFIA